MLISLNRADIPERITLAKGADILLDFDVATVTFSREANDLLMTGADGSLVAIADFFLTRGFNFKVQHPLFDY